MKGSKVTIFWVGVGDILVLGIGLFVWSGILHGEYDAVLAFTAIAVAVITFFGFLSLSVGRSAREERKLSEAGIRNAITVSMVTVYFVILALSIFLSPPSDQQPITGTLLTSFTTIVGIVIAFYFGSSAYVQVNRKRGRKERDHETGHNSAGEV